MKHPYIIMSSGKLRNRKQLFRIRATIGTGIINLTSLRGCAAGKKSVAIGL
jgi:hypothetical protein